MKKKKITAGSLIIHAFFIALALTYILPLCMVISTSFATQEGIATYGYTFFPKSFTTAAYDYVFQNSAQLFKAYRFTIFLVLWIPVYLFLQGMTAYGVMRAKWGFKFIRIIYFMGFFSGGMIATYVVYTQIYNIGNSVWVHVLPSAYSVWNVIMFRTFFKNNPPGLIEAAKIDGAGEFGIYCKIVIPISLPIFATQLIFTFLGTWNSWYTTMLYTSRNENMWTLGYMLQSVLRKAELQKTMAEMNIELDIGGQKEGAVTETLKYANLVLAAAPGALIMPFFQKYFQKGIIVGSIKE